MHCVDILPEEILKRYYYPDEKKIDELLAAELAKLNRKIVVIDDDPTGVQTVHDVYVYTRWDVDTLLNAFNDGKSIFFILSNSRGLTADESRKMHTEIAENISAAAKKAGMDYIIISRSDSTLRGHYPLEPHVLRTQLEKLDGKHFDGEIIYPFFKEGGRFTIDGVHYVKEGKNLVPAGLTEFAKDKSFGYCASYLPDWCEEKSGGDYKAADVTRINIGDLRSMNIEKITAQLLTQKNFNKVVVDSIDYCDVKVFTIAFIRAVTQGKEFMFRSAAAITKVLGGIDDKALLNRTDLVSTDTTNGGLIVVGSHVNKTTQQLEELKKCTMPITFVQFDQHRVLEENGLEDEVARVTALAEKALLEGKTVAVYTRRDRIDFVNGSKDDQLSMATKISDAVTSIVTNLKEKPAFIIAKGGITSNDIGTKALRVRKALVKGQVRPGIPVWLTDAESKFANMPYIIFPGNVGAVDDLRVIVENLMSQGE